MKTIMIPIFQGAEARTILRNDIFRVLTSKKNLRIILLVLTEEKRDYFQQEFHARSVHYEVISSHRSGFSGRIFSFLKKNLVRTTTLDLKRKEILRQTNNYPGFLVQLIFSRLFGYAWFRQLIRAIDFWLPDHHFDKIFDRYQPDLVLAAHIFSDEEAALLKNAKRRGIKTVGLISSWDKITSRGMVRVLPDRLITPNQIIADEAVKYLDIQRQKIAVLGNPQYDIFVTGEKSERSAFFKRFGLTPNQEFILFCPLGKTYSDLDATFINLLSSFIDQGILAKNLQILVRFPPNDEVDTQVLTNNPHLIFDRPGKRFSAKRGLDWDMGTQDIQNLLDELSYCSLLICPPSSLSIDAAIFNKPIINIGFQEYDPPRSNVNNFYKMEHYQKLLKTGGVRLTRSQKELIDAINNYLKDPQLDQSARALIVKQQCGNLDGRAGSRIAHFLLEYVSFEQN